MAINQIGDGKTPNKYWVSIGTDQYYQEGNSLNWQSEVIGGKQKSKIVKVFPKYLDAFNFADSIKLGSVVKGVIVNNVSIEDRLSGEVYFRTYLDKHWDIGFTEKKEKELGVKPTTR